MSDVTARSAAPLDEVMLAMDVADTLRHRPDLAVHEPGSPSHEQTLIDKLRDIYHQQGMDVPEHVLREGVAAYNESRFVYQPPQEGFGTALARLYVSRRLWGRPVVAVLLALFLVFFGYYGLWKPLQHNQAEQARIALSKGVPAQLDALYQTIFEETKVQRAVVLADALRKRGTALAAEGRGAAAQDAVDKLAALRDQLRQDYVLRIVNRSDARPGFWTIPEVSTAATSYYLVVEALDADGRVLSLPILDEESGGTQVVSRWGVRVPESLYDSILADKRDDGIIENEILGRKQSGYLDIVYTQPVLGGTVTRW